MSASESTATETFMKFIYGIDGIIGFTLTNTDGTDTNYYYKKNIQGDIIGIYNNNLELIAKYVYDAWGNHKISYLENDVFVDFAETNSYNQTSNNNLYIALKNPFRYRGYYYDTETKLYYLNSRYYDPEIARFINIDDISIINESRSILNGLNLFIYCNNNPVMHTDTNGQSWWSDFWNSLGNFFARAWNGITNFFKNSWDVIVGGIASIVLVGTGLALTIFSGGFLSILGSGLIGAGIGGFVNGVISKSNGNSFWGGFLGGIVSGGLTGLGLSSGPIGAFILGTIGSFTGSITTDAINGTFSSNSNYWFKLIANSLLYGLISIGAGQFSKTVELLNLPGFRDIFISLLVWSEFATVTLFEQSLKIVEQIAQFFKKFLI